MTDRVVYLRWVDSAEASHGWDEPRANRGRAGSRMESVGYVVAEDDESVTLAVAVDAVNGHALNAVTIWKPAITEWREVRWV